MDLQHMENGIVNGGVGSGVGIGVGAGTGAGAGRTITNAGVLSENDFQKLAQTVANSIQKILQNVSKMQRMANQCNTLQDSPDLKKQLHHILTYTHQLVSDTNNHVKELDRCKERHLKIQRDRLVDDFTAALTSFKGILSKTVDIEKSQVLQARAHQLAKPPGSNSNNQSNSFFDDNTSILNNKKSQQQQQQQLQIQDDIDIQALEEQEKAIRELEDNILAVNEIYKKLGAMVYEQGLTVDSIESSVEQTSVFVSEGTERLRKASSYKNKIRKKKLILFSVLFAVAIVLLIILITQFNGN